MNRLASSLFRDFNSKNEESLNLEDLLEKAKREAKLLKEEILNEPKLHEILTTVGVLHDDVLYKKKNRAEDNEAATPEYYLDAQEYIEPVHSFQLKDKLGESNE